MCIVQIDRDSKCQTLHSVGRNPITHIKHASVAKLVNVHDLESCDLTLVGSTPTIRTKM